LFPIVDVKKSRSSEKQRKEESDVDEKLSEMVLFSLSSAKEVKSRVKQ
jgi:hypothetical protein